MTDAKYHVGTEETLCEGVLSAVEEETGTPAEELEVPLYEAVDPEALNTIFDDRPSGTVTFPYVGYRITVHSAGKIHLKERE